MKDKDGNFQDVIFGDWDKAIIKDDYLKNNGKLEDYEKYTHEDYIKFFENFNFRIQMSHFLKNVSTKQCLKILEEKGVKKMFYDKLNFKIEHWKQKSLHRPKSFIEGLKPIFFLDVLFNMIRNIYGNDFINEKCKFTKSMKEFIHTLKI